MTSALLQDEGLKAFLRQEGLVGGGDAASHAYASNNVVTAVRVRPISESESKLGARICVETRGQSKLVELQRKQQKQQQQENDDVAEENDDDEEEAKKQQQQQQQLDDNEQRGEREEKVFSQVTLTCAEDQRKYNFGFPAVFGMDATQHTIYETLCRGVVDSVLEGYNGCIFAYGQTGAGKTFAMLGPHSYGPQSGSPASLASNSASAASSPTPTIHFDPTINISSPQLQANSSFLNTANGGGGGGVVLHSQQGIIPRAANHIFGKLREMYNKNNSNNNDVVSAFPDSNHDYFSDDDYTVTVANVEIYLDRVRDLLDTSRANLAIRENRESSFFVENVSEHVVRSAADVIRLMERGAKSRVTSSSKMNDRSSRSHSILTMTVHRKHAVGESPSSSSPGSRTVTVGRLQLVDLAGSERVGKSGIAAGAQLDEACAINKSLSHLSEVISAVLDGRQHIPYRSCALTKLLSSSLGGNSRTALLVCCSPSSYNEQETLSSLRFGSSASGIKNRATMNRLVTEDQMRRYVTKLWTVIKVLERDNVGLRRRLGEEVDSSTQLVAFNSARSGASQGHPAATAATEEQQQLHGGRATAAATAAAAAGGRRNSTTAVSALSLSAMTPDHYLQQQQQHQHSSSSLLLPSPDALAMQFVNQVARFASVAQQSQSSLSPNHPNSNHGEQQQSPEMLMLSSLNQQQQNRRSISPAAAASFNAEMQLALSQAARVPITSSGDDNLNNNPSAAVGEADQPATSRDFSPAPMNGNSSNNNQQDEQHQQQGQSSAAVAAADQHRYVTLLKEMNDAINEIDEEAEEADFALRELDNDDKLQIFSNNNNRGGNNNSAAALIERIRTLEEDKETLELNLAMWQAAMKDVERNKSVAWTQLERQSLQISSLLSELEKQKQLNREAVETIDKMRSATTTTTTTANNNKEVKTASNSNGNKKNDAASPPSSLSQTLEGSGVASLMGAAAANNGNKKEGRSIEIQTDFEQQQQDWLSEFNTAAAAAANSTDVSAVNNSNSNTSSSSSKQPRSPMSLRAVEALMQRALTAEKQASDQTALASRLYSEKEQAEADVTALRRQNHIMEQRIIALRRVAEAERTVQHLAANPGAIRLSSLYGAQSQQQQQQILSAQSPTADGSPHHHHHQHQRGRSRSVAMNELKDLQEKNNAMQSAVERLQAQTRQVLQTAAAVVGQ